MHIHLFKSVQLSEFHIHRYAECRCGKRVVRRGGCCQPIAKHWLDGRDYDDDPMRPPTGPNDATARRPAGPIVFHPTITWTFRDYVLRATLILALIALALWLVFVTTDLMMLVSEN